MKEIVLEDIRYPKENSSYSFAAILAIVLVMLLIAGIFITPVSVAILILISTTIYQLYYRYQKLILTGNSIKVIKSNYPRIAKVIQETKKKIGLKRKVYLYIINPTNLRKISSSFHRNDYLFINSKTIENNDFNKIKWLSTSFLGEVHNISQRDELLNLVLKYLYKSYLLRPIVNPYFRNAKLSGDNLGIKLMKGNISYALRTLSESLMGETNEKAISPLEILYQETELNKSFLNKALNNLLGEPTTIERYVNILAFAKYSFPTYYKDYLRTFDYSTQIEIDELIPTDYKSYSVKEVLIKQRIIINKRKRIKPTIVVKKTQAKH